MMNQRRGRLIDISFILINFHRSYYLTELFHLTLDLGFIKCFAEINVGDVNPQCDPITR